jgi:hypothetical protein
LEEAVRQGPNKGSLGIVVELVELVELVGVLRLERGGEGGTEAGTGLGSEESIKVEIIEAWREGGGSLGGRSSGPV